MAFAFLLLQVAFHPLMYLNGIWKGGSPLPSKETAPPVTHAYRHTPQSQGVFPSKHQQGCTAPVSHVAYSVTEKAADCPARATALRNQGMCLKTIQNRREKWVIDALYPVRTTGVCVYRMGGWLEVCWVRGGVD